MLFVVIHNIHFLKEGHLCDMYQESWTHIILATRGYFLDVADIESEVIGKNAYNLNIPRYVDTTEEEEEIDIEQVKVDLLEIQKQKGELLQSISETLKILGL